MSNFNNASLIVTPNAFKASKLYSIKPTDGSGDLSVTRATTATFVGSNGLIQTAGNNVPRLDYTNGSCPSILVEPQRTNLLLRSMEFDDVYWTKSTITIIQNTTISPNGTLTADTNLANGGIASTRTLQSSNISVTSGTTYTFSIYVKAGTNDFVQLFCSTTPGGMFANFNVRNGILGTVGTISGNNPISEITPVGNDNWYRCSITLTTVSSGFGQFGMYIVDSNNSGRNQQNTLNTSVFFWGAQLEAGENASSYIPTTASAVTRNADVISKSGLTGITTITETFENGTTNVISGSPTSYTMSQGRIKQVIGV